MAHSQKFALRATLPARDGLGPDRQTRIPLETTDILEAEDLGYQLGSQLKNKKFDWSLWTRKDAKRLTCGDFRKATRNFYETGLKTGRYKDDSTWKTKWITALNKLPEDSCFINAQLIEYVIDDMNPKTSGRRDQGGVLCMIAEKQYDWDMKKARELSKGYTHKELTERNIPPDHHILYYYDKIKIPYWKWFYAVLATYGLRPHEAAEVEINEKHYAVIQDDTKTGYHIAPPVEREWVKRMNVLDINRPPKPKGTMWKAEFTHIANQYFTRPRGRYRTNDAFLPFGLYDLRHAYAVRLFRRGIPSEAGAKFMGHSERTHTTTYRRWADAADTEALCQRLGL